MDNKKLTNFVKPKIRFVLVSTVISFALMLFYMVRFFSLLRLFEAPGQFVAGEIFNLFVWFISIGAFVLNLLLLLFSKIKFSFKTIKILKLVIYILYLVSLFFILLVGILINTGAGISVFFSGFSLYFFGIILFTFVLYLISFFCLEWTEFEASDDIEIFTAEVYEENQDENNIG